MRKREPDQLMRFIQDLRNKMAASAVAGRLRAPSKDQEAQTRCLSGLLRQYALTSRGKRFRITPGMDREAFRSQVPPCNDQALAPLIFQVEHMEPDVIWPGRAGKMVRKATFPWEGDVIYPVTDDFSRHLALAWREALLAASLHEAPIALVREPLPCIGLEDTVQNADPFRLNGLLGLLAAIETGTGPLQDCGPLTEDNADCRLDTFLRDNPKCRQLLVQDPAWLPSQTLFGGNAHQRKAEAGECSHLNHLQWLVTTSPLLAPLQESSRRLINRQLRTHEILATEAGIFAVQDLETQQGLRLLTGTGLYFEFVPLESYLKTPVENLGPLALDLGEVQVGMPYVLFVSTPAGLCRHDTTEIVRFTSTSPARIEACGRTPFILSCVGERLTERQVSECLHACCHKQDWTVVHFHVSPVEVVQTTGRTRGWHEWWVELKPGTRHTPTGPALAAMIDADLMSKDVTYARLRSSGQLDSPVVRLLIPGIFDRWMSEIGCKVGLHRPARCMPDRRFADALAALARFSD